MFLHIFIHPYKLPRMKTKSSPRPDAAPSSPRKSRRAADTPGTRQLLLEHGRKLVLETGLRGLSVRALAAGAGVNLGSFVYHFGTREQFISELVELWYQPIYAQIRQAVLEGEYPCSLLRLRAVLRQLIELMSLNAPFVRHLLADALAGEASAHAFLISLRERHPKLVLELMAKAQAEGSVVQELPVHLLLFVMSAVQAPVMIAGTLQGKQWVPLPAQFFLQLVQDPTASLRRLDWALLGICSADGRQQLENQRQSSDLIS